MSNINSSNIVITGAASGIGALMARRCGEKKSDHIILLDINEVEGQKLCDELNKHGVKTSFIKVDLSSRSSIEEAARQIMRICDHVDILINNAGIVTGKLFIDHTDDEIEKTININLNACMYLTRSLLPGMIERKKGHIVNIASAAGMAAHPKLSAYVASKWGLIGWSETLRLELEQGETQVKVSTITPYYIDTGMFKGVRSRIIPLLKPEKVAAGVLKAIEKNKIYGRMPLLVYAMPFFKGILPQRWFDFIVGQVFGVYKSMDTFQGESR
ncbi:MAG: SDR family oxidoreductase [bacterium]